MTSRNSFITTKIKAIHPVYNRNGKQTIRRINLLHLQPPIQCQKADREVPRSSKRVYIQRPLYTSKRNNQQSNDLLNYNYLQHLTCIPIRKKKGDEPYVLTTSRLLYAIWKDTEDMTSELFKCNTTPNKYLLRVKPGLRVHLLKIGSK